MKRSIIRCLLIVITVIWSNSVTSSQDVAQKPAPPPNYPLANIRRDFKNSTPFQIGEKLEFEMRFTRFPIYTTVGTITFEYLGPYTPPVADPAQAVNGPAEPPIKGLNIDFNPSPGERLLQMRASIVSKGVLIAIFGVDVKDRFESLVNSEDFSARLELRETKEGKKREIQSSVFDLENRQVKYLTTDLTKPDDAPRAKFLPMANDQVDGQTQEKMMGLLSAIYFLRLQKYKEGQLIRFPVSYDEQNYYFDIIVGKREKLKTDCGKVKTVRLEPQLFGPNKLFSRQGEMSMWVTDDRKHTPVRLVAKNSSGTVTARLTNFKNNCKVEDIDNDRIQRDHLR